MHKELKKYPISSFIIVFIVIIFSLYITNVLKTIPCDKEMHSIFISNFIHTDFIHLVSNLYGIYSLSRVEVKIGPKNFFGLLIFLLIFNTLFESILHKLINTPCSIGFSGVLYGVLTFEIVSNINKFDYNLVASIILNIIVAKIGAKNLSLIGHLVGAFSGIIGGILYKKVNLI
jgi:membrane associated rhomboid family serine protease